MNNKQEILKRLLKDNHITIDELFILNQEKILLNTLPILEKPIPFKEVFNPNWQRSHWEVTCTNLPSDYIMD